MSKHVTFKEQTSLKNKRLNKEIKEKPSLFQMTKYFEAKSIRPTFVASLPE